MTCIAATVYKGFVYMGCDSCASDGHTIHGILNPKIFKVDDFIIGCTTSFRMIDILAYALEIPKVHPDDNMEKFMRTKFIDAVRAELEDGGFLEKDDNVEKAGEFLVGYRDKLYAVQSDLSILTCQPWGVACGSGSEVALGSLYTTQFMEGMLPYQRLYYALQASSALISSVRGPHFFHSTNPGTKLMNEEFMLAYNKHTLAQSKKKR